MRESEEKVFLDINKADGIMSIQKRYVLDLHDLKPDKSSMMKRKWTKSSIPSQEAICNC